MAIKRVALQAATANLTQNQPITVDVDGFLISAGLLTYAYLQNVSATDKVLGRASAGAGVIEEIACTAAGRALIDDANAAAQRTTLGLSAVSIQDPVAVANGGTGSATAAAARLALGADDANGRVQATRLPTKLLNQYWHASIDEKTTVAGTWAEYANAAQTDYDSSLVSTAATYQNAVTHANNDEIHFGSLTFNAGTYKISFACMKDTAAGILEILLGTTSLGTFDLYAATTSNVVSSFTYAPTTRVAGNLRVKCTGKNAGSSSYYIILSRLEIIRTG